MRFKAIAVGVAIVALALSACSDDSSSSGDTTTTTSAVCAARSDLQQSVTALTDPSVRSGGKEGIQSALDTVKTDATAVENTASAALAPQAEDVQSAIEGLETALGEIGTGSSGDSMAAVGTALAAVGTSVDALVTSLETDCPSG